MSKPTIDNEFAPWPHFDDEMLASVSDVLRSGKVNYWTGEQGRLFEAEFAAYHDCRHAIALANGTVALELALHALEIGPGDEVVVPSRTFIATASSVVARGARPVCADVERDSQNITAATVEAVLSPRTRAVIPVHLAGWPCDMDPLLELARRRGLAVIEDCAQAHGARYKGCPVGTLGDVGCFSFCQDKIITTAGEGGMLITNNSKLWDAAWRYKDHGKTPQAFYKPAPPGATFRWLHESFGSNYRMSEVQAAIGRIALRRLDDWVATRRRNAENLYGVCRRLAALRTPWPDAGLDHAHYKFYTFVRPELLAHGWTRERIIEHIRGTGAPCYSGSCSEIYLEQAFPEPWKPASRWPIARELGETSLMFPVHPTLTAGQVDWLSHRIESCVGLAQDPALTAGHAA